MKFLKCVVWISIAMAFLLMAITAISFVFNLHLFGVAHIVNFLHSANSFLLLAVAIYLVTDKFRCSNQASKQ